MSTIRKAAIVGGGVIGGGWAARLAQNGVEVAVYDPDPDAEARLARLLGNAKRAFARLIDAPRPEPGAIRFAPTLDDAVAGADLVQESAPERLALKQALLAEIDRLAPPHALVASSTSGLLPSDLQARLRRPERFLVAHPFNPVYLVPLVEIVAGSGTAPETVDRARALYASFGMKPLVVRKEIEAFVGDRLLEALWREALWLVRDDVATVEEIDDVIRYSFGLRWAQMGLFQIYRIAGGEAGMRHFLAQFGPCLQWPWTKLTDVPDLTPELVDRIASQSDAQAGGLSIRDLERIRDDNLVAILRALARAEDGAGWGAGSLLNTYEAELWRRAAAGGAGVEAAAPLRIHRAEVRAEWTDRDGRMTERHHLQVLADATDAALAHLGLDEEHLARGHDIVTLETQARHLGRAGVGDRLAVSTRILAADETRLTLLHALRIEPTGETVATGEHALLHVDSRAGQAVPMPAAAVRRLADLARTHARLPPDGAGRPTGGRR